MCIHSCSSYGLRDGRAGLHGPNDVQFTPTYTRSKDRNKHSLYTEQKLGGRKLETNLHCLLLLPLNWKRPRLVLVRQELLSKGREGDAQIIEVLEYTSSSSSFSLVSENVYTCRTYKNLCEVILLCSFDQICVSAHRLCSTVVFFLRRNFQKLENAK